MTLDDLENNMAVMMKAFRVDYKLERLIKSITFQFIVPDFGLVATGMVASEYKIISDSVIQEYPDYRKIYIAHTDNFMEKKEDVLWALMRGGYIKWLRSQYQRDFKNLVVMQEFGKKIINKRLEVWDGQTRYNYLIRYNEDAKVQPATYMLSIDPSFFDYMPE